MKLPSLCAASLLAFGANARKTPVRDSKAAAEYLNAQFLGHGSVEESGVVMRQLKEWELFCGGGCYEGRPDCTVSAMFFNTKVGVWHSMFTGAFPFVQEVGVVFDTGAVQKRLARCYWPTDAQSWRRYNGGCAGMASEEAMHCSHPDCPYRNVFNGTFVDGDSLEATRSLCKSIEQRGCFWRGPAYNTSKGPWGGSELAQMVQQYEDMHLSRYPVQWNELVLDGRLIKDTLRTDPASIIVAAWYSLDLKYPREISENIAAAMAISRRIEEFYGVQFPLVAVNRTAIVTPEKGPFVAHQADGESASSVPGPLLVVA